LAALLLVPGPTLPSLEGLLVPIFLWEVAEPVVMSLFISFLVSFFMLLVAPGPTFPSLDAPGAGWYCAKTLPAESARAQTEAKMIFFMVNSLVQKILNRPWSKGFPSQSTRSRMEPGTPLKVRLLRLQWRSKAG
jgi:hypothetical protein